MGGGSALAKRKLPIASIPVTNGELRMMFPMPVLDVRNLTVTFPGTTGEVAAVCVVSFSIASGVALGNPRLPARSGEVFTPHDSQIRNLRNLAAPMPLELLVELETQFDVSIPDDDFLKARTPRDLMEMVSRLKNQGSLA